MPPGPSSVSGELSNTRSRYKDHSPTLGRKRRAAMSSPATCSSLFSFRLISPGGSVWSSGGGNYRVPKPRFPKRRQLSLWLGDGPALWRCAADRSAARGSEPLRFRRSGGAEEEEEEEEVEEVQPTPDFIVLKEISVNQSSQPVDDTVKYTNIRTKLGLHEKFCDRPAVCAAFKCTSEIRQTLFWRVITICIPDKRSSGTYKSRVNLKKTEVVKVTIPTKVRYLGIIWGNCTSQFTLYSTTFYLITQVTLQITCWITAKVALFFNHTLRKHVQPIADSICMFIYLELF